MNHSINGYELYRLLSDGEPHTIEVNGSTCCLQFQGDRIGVWSWLLVADAQGGEIRFSPGWSSEASWNALTTIDQGRWATPVGPWQDPAGLSVG